VPQKSPAALRFNRDIRPLLSENCFSCHGPDPASRQAGLRLDRAEGFFEQRESGAAVVIGQPEKSLLVQRILATDPDVQMPPPDSHKKLTAAQKTLLQRWVAEGAPWEPHWSFVAPQRPAVPQVKQTGWVRNPIDAFILAELQELGLGPVAEADRRTLIRRLSYDLRGLPPAPEEVKAFLENTRPDAYERLVDGFLDSPQYGEHRARYWLDAARYADTHGLHIDNYREIWPYRDWVIAAFNRNLPFDVFTREQIAGDLLPNRTLEQQIASGFHRCNITTSEGGAISDEVDAIYAKDRVETTATVWLGLTAGCASCHEHKFDPLTQKEFYEFVAFFRNTTQRAMDGNISDTPPVIVVPLREDRTRWEQVQTELANVKTAQQARRAEAGKLLATWVRTPAAQRLQSPVSATEEVLAVDLNEGQSTKLTARLGDEVREVELDSAWKWQPGPQKRAALSFGPKQALVFDTAGDLEVNVPFTLSAWVFVPAKDANYTVLQKLPLRKNETGWQLEINNRIPALRMYGAKGAENFSVRGNNQVRLKPGAWNHLCFTYDGSQRKEGFSLYWDGKIQTPTPYEGNALPKSILNAGPLRIGGDEKRDFAGGALQDLHLARRALNAEEVALLPKWETIRASLQRPLDEVQGADRQDLLNFYLVRDDRPYHDLGAQILKLEAEQSVIRSRGSVTHVMQEKPGSQPMARVLFRGQYDQPRDEVKPGTPAALPPFPTEAPRNRLGLSEWLMQPENPLTARVTVNRFWQEIFGQGIVKTSEDFGIMGENPTHPELLDWLAVEFRESGWDMRHMYKLLVTSATYRQVAQTTPDRLLKDPLNRYLSRGPRFRMDAETLRDGALAASGLLVRKIGGPSVKPYQPSGVWEAVAMFGSNTRFYKEDQGEGLYRRSLYTFWKRSAPPANMDLFNAPSRENCSVRRERTNTPLQALATMNDPQWVEAARHLASKALRAGTTFEQRLDELSLRVLSRPFDAQERSICREVLDDLLTHYQTREDDAKKLIATGASPPDTTLAPAELAAWTMLASEVLNLDEALCK